jgi:hypothetical protein
MTSQALNAFRGEKSLAASENVRRSKRAALHGTSAHPILLLQQSLYGWLNTESLHGAQVLLPDETSKNISCQDGMAMMEGVNGSCASATSSHMIEENKFVPAHVHMRRNAFWGGRQGITLRGGECKSDDR